MTLEQAIAYIDAALREQRKLEDGREIYADHMAMARSRGALMAALEITRINLNWLLQLSAVSNA